jgi:hypothetical protein
MCCKLLGQTVQNVSRIYVDTVIAAGGNTLHF